jgi:peptide deformylase
MSKLRIYPDPALRNKAQVIDDFSPDKTDHLIKIMDGMERVIAENEAVGLAANQIGVLEQIVVAISEDGCVRIVNPQIVEQEGKEVMIEGCLSVPETEVEIPRSAFVVVKGVDEHGNEKIIEATDLLARALQHEIDHLNGILIIDKMPPTDRVKFEMNWKP